MPYKKRTVAILWGLVEEEIFDCCKGILGSLLIGVGVGVVCVCGVAHNRWGFDEEQV